MSYTVDDFGECLSCAIRDTNEDAVRRERIARVIAAWGKGNGMGDEAPHYRAAESSATDWCGGFLCALVDGRFAYVSGWCDYTGWG